MNRTLFKKWKYYKGRYGVLHALTSYVGRFLPMIWPLLGPTVTRKYLNRWKEQNGARYLNIGSGSNLIEGMLNLDKDPRSDVYLDLQKELPFANCSIDGIYCEEVIEHLPVDKAVLFLKECLRVLKPSGTLRLSTPNLSYFIADLRCDNNMNLSEINDQLVLFEGAEKLSNKFLAILSLNSLFYCHGHKFIYLEETLHELLQFCGFKEIINSFYKDNRSLFGFVDSHAERFKHSPLASIYFDCKK